MAGSTSGEAVTGKALLPFLQRADELQKHDPLVAYYCRLYAMDKGLRVPSKERSKEVNGLLVSIMGRLEKDKAQLQLSPDDGLHVEGFAQRVFSKADKQDRAGRADITTAKTFYAAGIFFEVCRQFGDLAPEVEQKQRYAVWKAADIRKALAEGRRPTPGPPGGDAAADGGAGDSTAAAAAAAATSAYAAAPPAAYAAAATSSFPSADSLDAAARMPPYGSYSAPLANSGTAPPTAYAPSAAHSFPSADSLDAAAGMPPYGSYSGTGTYNAPPAQSGPGGSGRLQVARPVGSGAGSLQPQPPQTQSYSAPPALPQQAAPSQPNSSFITSFSNGTPASAPSQGPSHPPSMGYSQPPTAFSFSPSQPPPSGSSHPTDPHPSPSYVSPPTFTQWAPDPNYPSSATASTAPSPSPYQQQPQPYQQQQAPPAASGMFAAPSAQYAAPGAGPPAGAASAGLAGFSFPSGGAAGGGASQGMAGMVGGTVAQPSHAAANQYAAYGGDGVAAGRGSGPTRSVQNPLLTANGPTVTSSSMLGGASSSQGLGPREIADAHKAARYAVSALAGNDVPTAVDFIRKALALLEPGGSF